MGDHGHPTTEERAPAAAIRVRPPENAADDLLDLEVDLAAVADAWDREVSRDDDALPYLTGKGFLAALRRLGIHIEDNRETRAEDAGLSGRALEIARHALAWPRCYRNHFATNPGSEDKAVLEQMVGDGWAIRGHHSARDLAFYHMTQRTRIALDFRQVDRVTDPEG